MISFDSIIVPDVNKIESLFSLAASPAFFLGAVAAFVSLMMSRLALVNTRMQQERDRADNLAVENSFEDGLSYFRQRAKLLHDGIMLGLSSSIFITLLLSELFVSQLFSLRYAYGSSVLFMLAALCLAGALCCLILEVRQARLKLLQQMGLKRRSFGPLAWKRR